MVSLKLGKLDWVKDYCHYLILEDFHFANLTLPWNGNNSIEKLSNTYF